MEPTIIDLDLLDKLLALVSIVVALRFVREITYCHIGLLFGALFVVASGGSVYSSCSFLSNSGFIDSLKEYNHCLPLRPSMYFKAGWLLIVGSLVGYLKIGVLHLAGRNKENSLDAESE